MQKMLVLALAVVVTNFALASPAGDAAAKYDLIHLRGKTCQAEYQLAGLKAQRGEGTHEAAYKAFLGCRTPVMADAKKVYSQVQAKLKSADAKNALKDYHVSLMSYLQGIESKTGETEAEYAKRMNALDSAIQRAWQRLELEL